MTKTEIIKYSVIGLIAISLIAISISMLTAFRNKGDNSSYKDVVAAKDESIKILKEQRDMYLPVIEQLNKSIDAHEKKDSVLNELFISNQKKYKANDAKLSDISNRINRISGNNDSLRRAIADL